MRQERLERSHDLETINIMLPTSTSTSTLLRTRRQVTRTVSAFGVLGAAVVVRALHLASSPDAGHAAVFTPSHHRHRHRQALPRRSRQITVSRRQRDGVESFARAVCARACTLPRRRMRVAGARGSYPSKEVS